jgi:hypothetical protein
MMKERTAQMPAELVIATSLTLLGILAGVGAAFILWSQLHHTAAPSVLTASVVTLAIGMVLVAVAAQRFATRLFLLAAACSLAIAFFAGAGAFSHLVY